MKFSYFLIGFMILLAIPAYAKVTEISTTCDIFDCVSYFNIDSDLSAIKDYKANIDTKTSKYAYGDFIIHAGSVKDVKIEIVDKNTIKIYGSIEGASNNLWGFSILTDYSHINSTWWNSSYQYKIPINISNTYGNLVNYPVNISFTSANVNYSKMLSSGCDLRFTDNLSNLLNHYIETWNASGTTSVWVNVSSLLNNTNTTVYMYYGNSSATCTGNVSKVFDIYDNFSTNNNNTLWNMTGNMYVNTTAGYLYSYGSETGWNINTLKSISTFSRKEWLIFYGKYYGGAYFSPRWQLSTTTTAGEWNPLATTMAASMHFYYQYYLTNVVWTCQQGGCVNNTVWSTDTWSEFKIILRNSGHQWYYRNLSMASWVNPLNTSNCTDTSLKIALSVYGGTTYWDDLRVYQQVPSGISYTFGTEEQQCYNVTIGTPIYNATTTERKLERYYINIITSTNITNATAYLTRNGTIYQSEVIATYNFSYGYTYLNMYEFNNTFFTPYLSNSSLLNETVILNWTFFITYANGTQVNFSSNNYNQLVETFFLSTCTSGYPIALNFTIFNEESMPSLINSSFNIYGTLAKGYEISKNFSFSFSGYSNYSICIYPNDTISVNATIEYYSNTDYPLRNYYLFNSPVSNATQSYNLYLLNATQARKVKISVIDSSSLAVKQAIISIQRYDYTTSAYITMTMAKTDDQGTAITYLRGNDMFYKFMITKNGVLLADLAPLKIDISAITNEGTLTLVADPTVLGEYYTFISSVAYGCTLNRTTDILRCSFADATGDTQTLTLQVDKITPLRKTSICDTIASSSSATLTCTIAGANGTYAYRFYAMRSGIPFMLETGSFAFTSAIEWGVTGLFLTLVLFLTLSGVGIYKPEMALVMGGGALIVASVLNLMAIEILSGSIGGMIVVIAILIYRMRGRD